MGAMQNNPKQKGRKKGKRGSVNNSGRLEAFSKRGGGDRGDWGECNADRLQAVVVGITSIGGAVTFGMSRNGNSHSVTLMLDGERSTLWFNGNADLDEELGEVLAYLEAMAE